MPTTLDLLALGETARIHDLSLSAPKRRRLQELGFLPGAEITALHQSPWGDPVAYAVAGAVIALRRADARSIVITGKDENLV